MSDRDAVYESAIRELEEALAEVARLQEEIDLLRQQLEGLPVTREVTP